VSGEFVINDDTTVSFAAGNYDHSKPLIVDPTLDYSSYLGGSGTDTGTAIAVDGTGHAYVVGNTPALSGYATDAYVAKFAADGTALVYKTYLGGASMNSSGTGIGVDAAGNAVAVGTTMASDFPVTSGAIQTTPSPGINGFAARLNATGDALLYCTYLGYTSPNAVAVGPNGLAYVTGSAQSGMTTTTGAYQTTFSGMGAAFVSAIKADGTAFIYSTFLGGTGFGSSSAAYGIAMQNGSAYVVGSTQDSAFPTTSGAYQTSYGSGSGDPFVTKFVENGHSLAYSTFLGYSGQANAVAVDPSGNAYVTGYTGSSSFPTTSGAYQTSLSGATDAFVSKLNSAGSALGYSTYLGGSSTDQGNGISVTSAGDAIVAGGTGSTNFPTASALSGTGNSGGSSQSFLTEFNSGGTGLAYSTYLGTTTLGSTSTAYGVGVDRDGNAYVAGQAGASFHVTTLTYQATYGGGSSDAFLLKVDDPIYLQPPAITGITTDTGYSSTDFITNDQTLSISGTSPASVTVRVYLNNASIGTTTSNSSGSWSFDYTGTTLPEGVASFAARAESGGSNSAMSPTVAVQIDLTAPAVVAGVSGGFSLTQNVYVRASDSVGLPSSATVTLDVDLNNDGDFADTGETGYATGHLNNGATTIPITLSASGTYRVEARVTDLAGNQGTSAAQTFTIGTPPSPWTVVGANVLTAIPGGDVANLLGDLQWSHPLDLDNSPGSSQSLNPAMIYNSLLINQKPIVQATVQVDNGTSLPATITATLTWNGTAQTAVNFSTSSVSKGDQVTFDVQSTAAVTSTGAYDWSLSITGTGMSTITASETAFIVDETNSPFGAGWSLSTLNQLVSISATANHAAGWLWVYGDGTSLFFIGTSGTLTNPPEDKGTLVVNGGGSLTYTGTDGTQIDFDSSGKQTDFVSTDGFTSMTYTYTSNLLTRLTALDGQAATLTYSSGLIASISAGGSRSWSFTMTSGDLTSITDPDTLHEDFTYTSHRMTDQQFGTLKNHWAFSGAGLLNTWRWGNSTSVSTFTIVPVAAAGLTNPVSGPGISTTTDPLNYVTTSTLDAKGRLLELQTPDGGKSSWTLDSAGQATNCTVFVDASTSLTTTYTRDGSEYVTTVTLPDSHTQVTTYNSVHEVTSYTDENGHATTYSYNSHYDPTGMTDAVGDVTTWTVSTSTGLATSMTDAMGRVATYAYDSYRRPTTTTTVLGTTTNTYDTTTGELATLTDPLSHTTSMVHDAMGRVTSVKTADNYVETWTYNTAGLPSQHFDKSGTEDDTIYDDMGRGLVAVTKAAVNTAFARVGAVLFDGCRQQPKPVAVRPQRQADRFLDPHRRPHPQHLWDTRLGHERHGQRQLHDAHPRCRGQFHGHHRPARPLDDHELRRAQPGQQLHERAQPRLVADVLGGWPAQDPDRRARGRRELRLRLHQQADFGHRGGRHQPRADGDPDAQRRLGRHVRHRRPQQHGDVRPRLRLPDHAHYRRQLARHDEDPQPHGLRDAGDQPPQQEHRLHARCLRRRDRRRRRDWRDADRAARRTRPAGRDGGRAERALADRLRRRPQYGEGNRRQRRRYHQGLRRLRQPRLPHGPGGE
jgi:YD repeat-containing protein